MSDADKKPVLEARSLSKSYVEGPLEVDVLKGVDLLVSTGDKIAIIGASGSGKSTLLHLLGGLDVPSEGDVLIDGKNISGLSGKKRGLLRNRSIGMIYQFHHLLPEFTAVENVAMPSLIAGADIKVAEDAAIQILKRVGLGERLEHKPGELSGGERQRTAIARAMINSPAIILADEPTGNLDTSTANDTWELMQELNQIRKWVPHLWWLLTPKTWRSGWIGFTCCAMAYSANKPESCSLSRVCRCCRRLCQRRLIIKRQPE